MVSGEESLEVCTPLLTVIPLGMALSMEVRNDSEVLDIGGTLDVSKWVKNRIPSFSRVIGLSVHHHEKLCIAYLQRLEREMGVINQQRKKATANQKVAFSLGKGKKIGRAHV